MVKLHGGESVFVCASYKHKDELNPVFAMLDRVLVGLGYTPAVYVLKQDTSNDFVALMKGALEQIKHAKFVIAEVSYKKIGIGIELGYAYALHKPIVYIRRAGSPVSTTVSGIANAQIVYGSLQELEDKLSQTVSRIGG